CRDYSRVDIRIDAQGNPFVLEINSMASLGGTSSYVLAAATRGYTFASMINRILDVAYRRYFGRPAPRRTLAGNHKGDLATAYCVSRMYKTTARTVSKLTQQLQPSDRDKCNGGAPDIHQESVL